MLYSFLTFLFLIFFILSIVHESIFFSIFFLITLFFISSFIFILIGFEFIGFLYLIVYVGAIAVLFLFMVMLFDKSEYLFFARVNNSPWNIMFKYFINFLGFLVACTFSYSFFSLVNYPFCTESFLEFLVNSINTEIKLESLVGSDVENIRSSLELGTNLQRIGILLYNYYVLAMFGAALILLVGMVGAIVLTQQFFFQRSKKHQDISNQLVRSRI
jgi:NADH:ubiquinone oxidoreductase subunit 6 (subunit J)